MLLFVTAGGACVPETLNATGAFERSAAIFQFAVQASVDVELLVLNVALDVWLGRASAVRPRPLTFCPLEKMRSHPHGRTGAPALRTALPAALPAAAGPALLPPRAARRPSTQQQHLVHLGAFHRPRGARLDAPGRRIRRAAAGRRASGASLLHAVAAAAARRRGDLALVGDRCRRRRLRPVLGLPRGGSAALRRAAVRGQGAVRPARGGPIWQ